MVMMRFKNWLEGAFNKSSGFYVLVGTNRDVAYEDDPADALETPKHMRTSKRHEEHGPYPSFDKALEVFKMYADNVSNGNPEQINHLSMSVTGPQGKDQDIAYWNWSANTIHWVHPSYKQFDGSVKINMRRYPVPAQPDLLDMDNPGSKTMQRTSPMQIPVWQRPLTKGKPTHVLKRQLSQRQLGRDTN